MKPHTSRFFLLLALLTVLFAGTALAERVYWEPGAGSLAYGQPSQLQLIFENCEPEGDPQLPAVDGLEMQFTGSGSTFSMENMNVTRRRLLSFAARPTKRPEVHIPSFTVETNKGTQRVAAATFAIGNATVGKTAIPLETAVTASLTPATGAFWAGEVFPVTYTLDIAQRFSPRGVGAVQWQPAPLVVEDWSQPERFDTTAGGEPRVGLIYRSRGYVTAPGSYTLKPASQDMALVVPSGRGLFLLSFDNEVVEHTATSNAPALTIKPLPGGAPADFAGAVGEFTLKTRVVPATVSVGEPITWTLELTGTGNWPDIHGLPAREVSRDFKVLQPQAKRTPAEGKLFNATLTEDVVLIPTQPGTYTLAPASFSYFDPRTGTYQTAKNEQITVTVNPPGTPGPAVQSFFNPPPSPAAKPTPPAATYSASLPAPPPAPAAIPRDPLSDAGQGWVPLSGLAHGLWLVASILWLLPAWLIFAALRARRTDPLLARRAARGRLVQTLAYLRGTTDAGARTQALHAWQRDTATLLGIAQAAPVPATLFAHGPGPLALPSTDQNGWTTLWDEADRALYGHDHALPDDWQVRAEAALETTRVPPWPPSSLFQPRNLLPWFAVLILLFAIGVPRLAAQNAETAVLSPAAALTAYATGDFAAAERTWRDAVARTPTDWVARHNLALALAQQGHWPEAAAQWSSAFVLNPRHESVRWHLALGFERAGYTPPGFGEFAQPSGPHLVARLASPAEWQWLLVLAGAMLATGLLVLLWRAYRTPAAWMRPAALAALGAAALLALCALLSLHFYGEAADPRAAIAWHQVLLRSIPTEADTQQKTASLPAGSLAIVDRTFLGWARLAFPNGQTGWVRQEDIVWLYR